MSSGANLLVAVMATCSVASGGVKAILFYFLFYTNGSEPPEVWIFEFLCICVFIQILES